MASGSLRFVLDLIVRAERSGVAPTPGELRLAPAGDRGCAPRTPAAKARHLWRPAVRGGAPSPSRGWPNLLWRDLGLLWRKLHHQRSPRIGARAFRAPSAVRIVSRA